MTAWILLAAGVLLLPAPDRAGDRLRWLATQRWQATATARPLRRSIALPARFQRLVGTTGCLCLGAVAGPVPALLAGFTGWTLLGCWRRLLAERAAERDRVGLALAVDILVAEYAAGTLPGTAFQRAAPVAGAYRDELAHAAELADLGALPAAALARTQALSALAVATALVGRTGASFTSLLAGVAADLAAERATRRALAAVLAGPRASAVLLAGLPAVGLAMGFALGANPVRMLLHTDLGLVAMSIGVLLDLAGLAWTLRLTRPTAW